MRDDEVAIQSLLIRYASAIDQKDWELFGSCFEPDCRADYQGHHFDGIEQLTKVMRELHDPLDASLHRMSNMNITVDGEKAEATSYVDALLIRRDHPAGPAYQVTGFYEDLISRNGGIWRIKSRIFRPVWIQERETSVMPSYRSLGSLFVLPLSATK